MELSVEDIKHQVNFFEIGIQHLEVESDQVINWPAQINGQEIPRMDCVLVLCDVTSKERINAISTIFGRGAFVYFEQPMFFTNYFFRRVRQLSIAHSACVVQV